MTDTAARSQLSTTGRLAVWTFAIGLAVAFIGIVVMSSDVVMIGAIAAVVGLLVALVVGALRLFGKR